MQFSSKIFLTALATLFVAHITIAAPVSNSDFEIAGRAEGDALTPKIELAEDFSISDLKNALSTAATFVQKIATTAKPVVDAISKVASVTPLAPEAALIDTAVNAATKIPVGAINGAAAAAPKVPAVAAKVAVPATAMVKAKA